MKFIKNAILICSVIFNVSLAQAIEIKPEMGLGIRGNGENIAAHWGGMARLIEEYGPYGTVAGGSSASITIFLYESSLLNPHVTCSEAEITENPDCEKERLSFLIKSYEGILDALPETVDIANLKNVYEQTLKIREGMSKLYCHPGLNMENFNHLNNLAKDTQNLIRLTLNNTKNPLIRDLPNWELFQSITQEVDQLKSSPSSSQLEKVKRLLFQVKKAFDVFGKFDAKTDEAIFVRPGLINFNGFAGVAGKMANLLAGRGLELDQELNADFKNYMTVCSKGSIGKEWESIKNRVVIHSLSPSHSSSPSLSSSVTSTTQEQTCGKMLNDLVLRYYHFQESNKGKINSRENDLPGETVPHFYPILTTAIVDNEDTINKWQNARQKFMSGEDQEQWKWKPHFNDVKFGYWVKKDQQQKIEENLKKICEEENDFKSCKGMIIGNHTWKTILSLSPAEPGLARIQHFKDVLKNDKNYLSLTPEEKEQMQTNMISLGGWADLMPQKILKAAETESQTLITRRGYDTYFGQGVTLRLGIDDLTHDELDFLQQKENAKEPTAADFQHAPSQYPSNPKKRTTGDWARGYNLHNPNSSFNQSLLKAAAVLCTHWDGGPVTEWRKLIKDAYNSIFYVKDTDLFPLRPSDQFTLVKDGETPADLTLKSGAKYIPVGAEGLDPESNAWFNRGCTEILKYAKDLPMHQTPYFPNGEKKTSAPFQE